ncbi:MAG TPA: SEC-C metal-binding domain-containing protein [Bryobacteraceae bacterium]|nr:SEC-C metal-binding domain-containing protein [Bryobacteraceae bacterium]
MTPTPVDNQNATPGAATGPRTAEGKARSSQNATKIGLYTARDFIRPGEEDEYILGFNNLIAELDPQTPLEYVFTTEIMSANWRLRRCRVIEADLALLPEPDEKAQRSVDRARSQSHSILRRSLAELRKLQTERAIRAHVDIGAAGLAETQKILQAMKSAPEDAASASSFCQPGPSDAAAPSSFCKPTPTAPIRVNKTPRNAPCPCRSGRKYKKCCGNPATQPMKIAA